MYSFLHDESNFARLNKQLRASWKITFVAVELLIFNRCKSCPSLLILVTSWFVIASVLFTLSLNQHFLSFIHDLDIFAPLNRRFWATRRGAFVGEERLPLLHNICNFRGKFCIQRLNYTEIIPKVDDEISKQRLHSLFPVFDPELLQKISRIKRPTSTWWNFDGLNHMIIM